MADVTDAEIGVLLPFALGYLYSHGGVFIQSSRAPKDGVVHIPFSLLPWCFPQKLLEQGIALAAPFNELVDSVSRDPAWLLKTLERTAEADPFTGRLVSLYNVELAREKRAVSVGGGSSVQNPLRLGLHRSDYMLTSSEESSGGVALKQVELNTVASSMAGLATVVSGLHAKLFHRFASELPGVSKHFSRASQEQSVVRESLPCSAIPSLAVALKEAHTAYLRGYPGNLPLNVCVCVYGGATRGKKRI